MVRIIGLSAIAVSIAIIAFKAGYEAAKYHASPTAFFEAARLRIGGVP